MSKINWTEEQTLAIDTRGKNLLVSAAAGSGKTALLTERLKRLVLNDKIDVSRLLVLTFTRAAATEMKQRFKTKLFDALTEEGWNLSHKEILNQINALTDANISTIDSFAQKMLKRHFEILDLDPNFRIADPTEIGLLIDETIDEVFEELFVQHESTPTEQTNEFIELIDLFGGSKTNENLKNLINTLSSFLHSLDDFNKWAQDNINELENLNEDNVFELYSLEPYYREIENFIDQVYNDYQRLEDLNKEIPWKKGNVSKDRLVEEIENIYKLKEAQNLKELIDIFKSIQFQRVTLPRNLDSSLKEEILSIRGDSKKGFLKEIKDYQKLFNTIDKNTELHKLKRIAQHFKYLYNLTNLVNGATRCYMKSIARKN